MKEITITMAVCAVAGLLAISGYAVELKPVPCGKTATLGARNEVIRPGNPRSLFRADYMVDVPDGTIYPTLDGVIDSWEWSDAVQIDISDTLGKQGEIDPPGTVIMWLKYLPNPDTLTVLWAAVENTADHVAMGYDQVGIYVDDNKDEQWSPCFGGADGQSMEGNFWSVRAHQDTLMFREIRWPCNPCDTAWLLISAEPWSKVATTGGNVTYEFMIFLGDYFWMINRYPNKEEYWGWDKDFPTGLWTFCLNDTVGDGSAGIWNGWYPQVCNGYCDLSNFAVLDPSQVMVSVTDDFQDNLGGPGITPDNGGTMDFEGSYTNTVGSSIVVYRWVDMYMRKSNGCDGHLVRSFELKPNPITINAGATKTYVFALGPVPDKKAGLKLRLYHRLGHTLYDTESEMFYDEDTVEKQSLGNVPLSMNKQGPSSRCTFGLREDAEVSGGQ
jgi:hypothetical protein